MTVSRRALTRCSAATLQAIVTSPGMGNVTSASGTFQPSAASSQHNVSHGFASAGDHEHIVRPAGYVCSYLLALLGRIQGIASLPCCACQKVAAAHP